MPDALLTSAAAFISTNLDDLFLLTLYFSQAETFAQKRSIVLGQYLGIAALTTASLLAASAAAHLPAWCIALMGLIPIALGIKECFSYKDGDAASAFSLSALSVCLITISNGADNLGVYIPLFTGYGVLQILSLLVIFALLTALWCFLGMRMAAFPHLRAWLQRYRRILGPAVLMLLGLWILLENLLPVLT